jgi:hypothetical protein
MYSNLNLLDLSSPAIIDQATRPKRNHIHLSEESTSKRFKLYEQTLDMVKEVAFKEIELALQQASTSDGGDGGNECDENSL